MTHEDRDRVPWRDHNQTRYADGRHGRLRYGEGGRYHGTDYDDPRAEYERSQSAGWEGGDAHAEREYGRHYSESGGSRGSEHDEGRARMQRRGPGGRDVDDGPNAGRYGGYAAEEEAVYGPQRRDYGPNRYGYEPTQYRFGPGRGGSEQHGFREYPQERYGMGGASASPRDGRTELRDYRDRPAEGGGDRSHEAHGRWPGSREAEGRRGAGGQRGRGPRNYTRSDARITEDVHERLTHDEGVDATDITVTVSNGEVTLQGPVDDRRTRHRIEDIVADCPGVKDVDNRIRVGRNDDRQDGTSSTSRGAGTRAASSPSSTS
ncbi:MAG: BON domain-containing protein [Lysobacteraceae bacterium]